MRGGGAGLTQTYGSEVLHCLWFGKVRPKKKKKKGHNQLIIAAHLTSYAFIAYKLHTNPSTHCSNAATALLE